MRKAFSMITAIFVIVLMATVSVLILNISSQTVKATTIQYKQEQAILYAKSYTELAIMYATANDPTLGNCPKSIDGNTSTPANIRMGNGYSVHVDIAYLDNVLLSSCTQLSSTIATPYERHIIIDTYVKYHDDAVVAAWTAGGTPPWLTYHRRTLQKL